MFSSWSSLSGFELHSARARAPRRERRRARTHSHIRRSPARVHAPHSKKSQLDLSCALGEPRPLTPDMCLRRALLAAGARRETLSLTALFSLATLAARPADLRPPGGNIDVLSPDPRRSCTTSQRRQHAASNAYHNGRVLVARPFLDAFFGRTSLGLPSQAVTSGSLAATSGGADTYRPALP